MELENKKIYVKETLHKLKLQFPLYEGSGSIDPIFDEDSLLCFEYIIDIFNEKDYLFSKEILLLFIDLRPNFPIAYEYIALCYKFLNQHEEKEKIYLEYIQWTFGDWNTAMDMIEKARETKDRTINPVPILESFIDKVSFFIDNVPEFYESYKMRSKAYRLLGMKNECQSDIDMYNKKVENYGPQKNISWCPFELAT